MAAIKTKPKKNAKGRNSRSFLIFTAINIIVVAWIAVHEFGSDGSAAHGFSTPVIRMIYLIPAVGCLALAVLMGTMKYGTMIRASEGRNDPRGAFECAVLGKYYDNITPFGAGGQPFQIIYLKKRGMSSGTSAALPIAGFLALQFAFVIIAAFVFIFGKRVSDDVVAIRISAYVGLAFYLFIPVCILLFTVRPKQFSNFVCSVVRLLGRMHIVKDYDKTSNTIIGSISDYSTSLQSIRGEPLLTGLLLLYSIVYQVAIMSVPFFVLRAFGGMENWRTVFSLVVYIYAAVTIIPTPGNSGVAEGSFYAVFSSLSGGYLFWAMVAWRLLVYYGWLAIGLIVVAFSSAPKKQIEKRQMPPGPLRVALFTDIFYPSIDGVVRTVDAYAKRMKGSCVVCPRDAIPCNDRIFGYKVIRTPAVKIPGVAYLIPAPFFSPKIKKYFAENRFDVLHAHSPFMIGRCALRLGKKYNIPVVATFHSKYYDDVLNITHSRLIAKIITNYIVGFYCRADAVWACSAKSADTLRSYGFRGDISVMENGTDDLPHAHPDSLRRRARLEFSLPKGKRILLFVGQQIWQKNLRLVLEVSKLLRDGGGNYCTVIAGCGYNGDAIKAMAGNMGLTGDGSVIFTGRITDRDLLCGLYLSSDLFFFPSLYDNAPLVMREAALLGLPSLLVAGSNSAEKVTDGVNGYTAENDSKIMAEKITAIFDSGTLALVGAAARSTIPISWDEIVGRASAMYRTVEKQSWLTGGEEQLAESSSDGKSE